MLTSENVIEKLKTDVSIYFLVTIALHIWDTKALTQQIYKSPFI